VAQEQGPKKLATIMAVDLVGYSALAEIDETAAIDEIARMRGQLEGIVGPEGGRIFNTAGDGFMLEFASASGALAAAEKLCATMERQRVRIGVHLGDVLIAPGGDLLGHGVNIAARLQQAAKPGAIVVSVDVQRAVRGALASRLHAGGAVRLEKMAETIEIFTLEAVSAKRTRRRSEAILAVLPFDNDSDDDAMEFFSDGVADEIMLILLRQSALKVIGRTSAFQFRGAKKGEAAAALKATHVLDGSVRRVGDHVRVNAQLIECASGVALWSARFDRDIGEAFELQDDIAKEVASALKHTLTRAERPAIRIDPAAYDLYLRARQIWLTLSDIEEEQAETVRRARAGLCAGLGRPRERAGIPVAARSRRAGLAAASERAGSRRACARARSRLPASLRRALATEAWLRRLRGKAQPRR
jgi:adenylate cyclase